MSNCFTCADVKKEIQKRRAAVRPANDRIAKLREESVKTEVKISHERAEIITEFYKSRIAQAESVTVQRAMAFKLMEHVSLPVEGGQLIVGLRAPAPASSHISGNLYYAWEI